MEKKKAALRRVDSAMTIEEHVTTTRPVSRARTRPPASTTTRPVSRTQTRTAAQESKMIRSVSPGELKPSDDLGPSSAPRVGDTVAPASAASADADEAPDPPPTHIDLVYKYGCIAPVREQALALQLLGQASNYREDLRRAYNDERRILRDLYALLRAKDEAHHVLAYERSVRHARMNERLRAVRARRGHLVDHGTYWLVEEAMHQANQRTEGVDPIAAQLFDETGRIGAAIMASEKFVVSPNAAPNAAPNDAASPNDATPQGFTHKRVVLAPPDDRRVAELTLRIGAFKDGAALHFPVKMHRPIPPGSIVKRIAMQRTRSGHRFRWEMLATIAVPISSRPYSNDHAAIAKNDVVGVNLGWRLESRTALRVATANDADGSYALLVDTLDAFEYADAVRGFRDLAFDSAKEYVASAGVPGAEHARLWRDKDRMRRLAARTGELGANWWLARDRHLEDIECGVRSRAIRRRLDMFRAFAARLAGSHRYIALEDMRVSAFVGESPTHAMERIRSAAGLYLLQKCFSDRFGPDRTLWIPPIEVPMSRTCSSCGLVRGETVGPMVTWACAGCGASHHQDENAAAVNRAVGERLVREGKTATVRTRTAAKRKAKKPIDGVATGERRKMVVTPREASDRAAE